MARTKGAGVSDRAYAARLRATGAAATALAVFIVAACGSDRVDETAPAATAIQAAPPGTDIWLADLSWEAENPLPGVGAPRNLTGRPGYDNQPFFVPDGSGLWYTAVDEHDGQADIWRYDFATGQVARVTVTNPESEYSATPLPDGSGISIIRVEADSTQRLWRVDFDGANDRVVLEDVAPVGYHAWADERTLVMFVLGDPATLQRANLATGAVEVLASDIGRSIHRIPGSSDVSFVQRHEDGTSTIMRLPADGGAAVPIIDALSGGDFHTWAPNGTLVMADGSALYALAPGGDAWTQIADWSSQRLTLSRLAVSPDATQIAVVAEFSF
jgi:WD40 repeat protein